ncbi:hypothetical protein BDB01DRAFT_804014 [Pilobolus umbonatus]|nr:hypothetical protein BDB01DRAFT_804014 [Pilobolus umbonatus]
MLSGSSKVLDIRLEGEKYYFPGDSIQGTVYVHLKNTSRVNSIQLRFFGEVHINLKDSKTISLFDSTYDIYPHKPSTLEAKTHLFPFSLTVPSHVHLPSSMDLGKTGQIRYGITVIMDRVKFFGTFNPRIDYPVVILEKINVNEFHYLIRQEKILDILLPQAGFNQKSIMRTTLPRSGFTRGDMVPVDIFIEHFSTFFRQQSVIVELVRTIELHLRKHEAVKTKVLKKFEFALDIQYSLNKYHQHITCQLPIPPSTPPTMKYKEKTVCVHYKVRTRVIFSHHSEYSSEIPLIVGTYPPPAVPIDDDEEEDSREDIDSIRTCSVDDSSSIHSYARNNSVLEIGRSDSTHSRNSIGSASSYQSFQSWDNVHLTRNTSVLTANSTPERLPSNAYISDRSSVCSEPYIRQNQYYSQRHSFSPLAGPIGVTTHILQPVVPTHHDSTPVTNYVEPTNNHFTHDSDSSDSEDDILSILNKKKKEERRKRQT